MSGAGEDLPPAVASLARQLIAIPSHEDESAAGDRLEAWLRSETNAVVRRDEIGNVLARRGGSPASLAFVGHHDVVAPADSQVSEDGYVLEEEDGRLYGRGAADMKGALAAAGCAFRDADLPDRETLENGLLFASFVGEETGSRGARHAIESGIAPDRAIVCEGSTGYSAPEVTDVAIAHKGRRGVTLSARGSAAHASEPEAGTNAIYRACEAIELLRDIELPSAEIRGHTLTGSLAVTQIDGGTAWNVLPDHCTLSVDERTVPDGRVAFSQLEELDDVTWTIEQDLPPMACTDEEFIARVLAAARTVQPETPEQIVKPHATDAGWLASAGTDCVVCGPAEPGEAHTASESVGMDVLGRCYRLYRRSAESIVG